MAIRVPRELIAFNVYTSAGTLRRYLPNVLQSDIHITAGAAVRAVGAELQRRNTNATAVPV